MVSINTLGKIQETPSTTVRPAKEDSKIKFSFNYKTLERIENHILRQRDWKPQELLSYQIMAQKFQLQIEFATRIADGLNHALKRLQTQNQ
ncbi:MAG: hypothetical protein NZO16_01470 [Deltaproteobacteria bacterium]|nr:hypothetical protein [Deltaproteobacteria bacterium]